MSTENTAGLYDLAMKMQWCMARTDYQYNYINNINNWLPISTPRIFNTPHSAFSPWPLVCDIRTSRTSKTAWYHTTAYNALWWVSRSRPLDLLKAICIYVFKLWITFGLLWYIIGKLKENALWHMSYQNWTSLPQFSVFALAICTNSCRQ